MVGRIVLAGAAIVVVGAVALLLNLALGCSARTSYCSTLSLLGLLGVLALLVGLVIVGVSYRRRRVGVVEWSDELAAANRPDDAPRDGSGPNGGR